MKELIKHHGLILKLERRPLWWHEAGLTFTASGYGQKIPTPWIAHCSDNRTRRVYARCFSNVASLYVFATIDGVKCRVSVSDPAIEVIEGDHHAE